MNKFRISLVIVILLATTSGHAQPFGANGAHWHFNLSTWFPPYAIIPVEVVGSSPMIIGTDTCYMISIVGNSGCSPMDSVLTTQRNDSVLYFHQGHNKFELLYNYNAVIGDTQTIYVESTGGLDTSVQLVVTDTGSVSINGFWKRTYTAQRLNYYYDFGGLIIEDIGSLGFIFPQWGFCDPLIFNIRCYEDTIVGLHFFPSWTSCDTVLYAGTQEPQINPALSIGPVPANEQLFISFNSAERESITLEVFDLTGHLVSQHSNINTEPGKNLNLDISNYPAGIYILAIRNNEFVFRKKFVKF